MSYVPPNPNGQATMANSTPVVLPSDQTPIPTEERALMVTGQAAQTAVVNNILTTTAGTAATDLQNYRTATIQVVSTGTGGTFIFEQSNDNVNFIALPVFNAALVTGVPITAAITATASQIIYTFPIRARYVRLRIVTTITGGSIQAHSRFSTEPWTAAAQLVASNVAANALFSAAQSGTWNINTVTSATILNAIPASIADVASAAITTTTTTAAFTPTAGLGYQLSIPVTAVSGTNPLLVITIEESMDSGTNWFPRCTFRCAATANSTSTATGIYYSPYLKLKGNRVRYVQTITGTTPSITRAINRFQGQSDRGEGVPFKLISAATTNGTLVKAGITTISMLTGSNINAAARYLKIYDKATAPTVGTDEVAYTFVLPGYATGAGSNIPLANEINLGRGCGFAITGGATDADTTAVGANENIINCQVS